MTLQQVVNTLQRIALSQHNVRSCGYGDLYSDLNSNPNIKYDVFYLTDNQHQRDGDFDRYSFNLFYISRLENMDGDNMLQIHSIGKSVLDNIVQIFCEDYDAEIYGTAYYQTFTQRFADLTAGIYAIITLEVPKDSICIDE